MRKIILFIIGIVVILGAVLVAKWIIDSNVKEQPRAEKIVKTVFTETVNNQSVPVVIPTNGVLTAKNRLELFAEVQGVFNSSAHPFKTGQEYKRGQTLIRIDAAEFYASLQASKSDFYNLITSLMPDLRLDYPEAFPKWEQYLNAFDLNKSTPPLPDTSSENVKYFITGRGVYTAYYNLKNLEQRLGKYTITAPFNGVLTEALVTEGTLVRPGQQLGEYIDTSVFEVELAIQKNFSDLLAVGENVTLSTPDGTETFPGKVTRINGKIDQATQTIKVFVEVREEGLKEGMYLEAQLEAQEVANAYEISRKLLVDESNVYYVRDSILDIMQVEPVYFSPKQVIVKGIPDGTEILSRPIPGAYVGMLVKRGENTTADLPEQTDKTQN
ncbi:efflux RND transporter periplasmic adaptor subunit [Altibacter lentus]|uniref:efflux RND transporter periplasmic adaptor subunit n=1 Tax=Altibacter lentus TaxID=1223410 RepID=UPI00054EE62C|nr:HlyD family efflux transporter periplasmic adaptor subunit [Altibacter lentus]